MELKSWRYDARAASWQAAWQEASDLSRQAPEELTVATWNVWFGEFYQEERAAGLLAVLERRRPDVICLQEVTESFLARVLRTEWVRSEYWISDATGETVEPYGVILLSRLPIARLSLLPLQSNMQRRLLVADLQFANHRLVVATVHLESKSANSLLREEQLDEAQPALVARGPDAMLVGDFNFDADWPEEAHIQAPFADVWRTLKSGYEGHTMDTEVNRSAFLDKGKEKRVRFDRMLLRSPTGAWRANWIELLGTEPVGENPDVFPSDHFGLLSSIRRHS